MDGSFESREPHEFAAGSASLDLDHAAEQIEQHNQREHPENGDPANPVQRDLVKRAPGLARGLDQRARLLIRDADAALHTLKFQQELVFLHRAGRGVHRSISIALLGAGWHRDCHNEHERKRADDETCVCEQSGHAGLLGRFLERFLHHLIQTRGRERLSSAQVAMVSL